VTKCSDDYHPKDKPALNVCMIPEKRREDYITFNDHDKWEGEKQ